MTIGNHRFVGGGQPVRVASLDPVAGVTAYAPSPMPTQAGTAIDASIKTLNNPYASPASQQVARSTPGEDLELSPGAPEQHTSSIFFQDGTWHTLPPDQTRWAAGVTDEREGNLADTADDRKHDECDRGEHWPRIGVAAEPRQTSGPS